MPFDLRGWLSTLLELLKVGRQAMDLDPRAVDLAPQIIGVRIAIAIIFLAGVSEGFGTQAAVLFVNQLSRRNFYLNLLLAGFIFLVGAVAWIATIWLIAYYVIDDSQPLWQVLRVVSIGYIPLLFGFLGLAPFVGPGILYILHAWSFLIVLLAVERVFKLSLWEAFICTFAGWLLVQLLRRIISRPIAIVNRWWWTMTAGTSRRLDFDDVPLVLPIQTAGDGSMPEPER